MTLRKELTMPRLPRQINMDEDGLYHVRGQVAGPAGYYPFQVLENADQLLAIIRRYTCLFFCQVVELSEPKADLGNVSRAWTPIQAVQDRGRRPLAPWDRNCTPVPFPETADHPVSAVGTS